MFMNAVLYIKMNIYIFKISNYNAIVISFEITSHVTISYLTR